MAFRVHQTKEFTETVMPRYFHQTQYKSFQRQLHIYGFRRISTGLDKGSYYHPMFVKGKETFSLRMIRCKIKGPLNHTLVEEPNFYHAPEPVGSGMMTMVCLDQDRSDHLDGLQVGSGSTFFLSTGCSGMMPSRGNTDSVLSKAVSLPTLPFSQTRFSQELQEPKLRHNASCVGVLMLRDEIPAHNVMFGGNANHTMTTMMLQDDFQPLPLSRISQNRRMSLLGEGDEAFFSGKKFFIVEKPSSQPQCPLSSAWKRRHV
jgi:hypothetical protein